VADPTPQYQAAHDDAAAIVLERGVVAVSGPEAESYLQGQLSQDVDGLAPGHAAWSLLLAPAGRVDALLRVTRQEDGFLLDTDAGWGEAVADRLNRFKLRTKVNIEPLAWRAVAVRGPLAGERTAADAGAEVSVPAAWGEFTGGSPGGVDGVDLLGPSPRVPTGTTELDADVYEALRIEAGVPTMGAELTEKTIPAEAGVVRAAVSFTKGCFTGQELVARIDSRGGNVPRHLRGLVFGGPVQTGTPLHAGGKEVGWVTSAARSPGRGWIGLGYAARSVTPPAQVDVDGARVEVVELPFPAA
jgi:tRNA-modifying protein YgfZ